MTSSIYPISVITNSLVSSIAITDPGSGYTSTPTATIDAPTDPNGTTATAGTVVIDDDVIDGFTLTVPGTGYTDGETVTLAGDDLGTGAVGIAVIAAGIIQSITFTDRGTGFDSAGTEIITITGDSSGANDGRISVDSVADEAVRSISVSTSGIGYTTIPIVTITGGGGTDATATGIISIAVDTDILNSDIVITSDMVKPGGGGILRLYFTFVFNATPGDITVTNNGADKGALNADNDRQIITDGFYRFDIDVESGDNINLQLVGSQTATSIASINFIRAHLVQFGA